MYNIDREMLHSGKQRENNVYDVYEEYIGRYYKKEADRYYKKEADEKPGKYFYGKITGMTAASRFQIRLIDYDDQTTIFEPMIEAFLKSFEEEEDESTKREWVSRLEGMFKVGE